MVMNDGYYYRIGHLTVACWRWNALPGVMYAECEAPSRCAAATGAYRRKRLPRTAAIPGNNNAIRWGCGQTAT